MHQPADNINNVTAICIVWYLLFIRSAYESFLVLVSALVMQAANFRQRDGEHFSQRVEPPLSSVMNKLEVGIR
eukprot:3309349-Amphidinium_carterae.1